MHLRIHKGSTVSTSNPNAHLERLVGEFIPSAALHLYTTDPLCPLRVWRTAGTRQARRLFRLFRDHLEAKE